MTSKVKKKILTKHGITGEEAQRAFRDEYRHILKKERTFIRCRDELSGKYLVIVGDIEKGVLFAATCRIMNDREKSSYKENRKRRRG